MATSAIKFDERVGTVEVSASELIVRLRDGRLLSAPLDWFPRLKSATPEQRARWEIAAAGLGIHWPDLDEDIGVAGLLQGSGRSD